MQILLYFKSKLVIFNHLDNSTTSKKRPQGAGAWMHLCGSFSLARQDARKHGYETKGATLNASTMLECGRVLNFTTKLHSHPARKKQKRQDKNNTAETPGIIQRSDSVGSLARGSVD